MERNLVWNVYYHSINSREIKIHNVFDHYRFYEDVKKAYDHCKAKEEFAESVINSLRYYYWCKAEWEVLISPYVGGAIDEGIRVDISDQVINNWDIFIDYLWSKR